MRLDLKLVALGIAESRNKAKSMIEGGFIHVRGADVVKASYEVGENDIVTVDDGYMTYVGRGALKLEGALESFKINVNGLLAVDIGSSTGGFTECLLRHGASHVWAIDSGRGQLHPKLASDSRVTVCEGFNARKLTTEQTGTLCDIAVCDVSFISQTLLHTSVSGVLKNGSNFISLIKPQFEVGRNNIGKNGIVRNHTATELAVTNVINSARAVGFAAVAIAVSPIKGGDGNIEYFAHFVLGGTDVISQCDICETITQSFKPNERR